MTEHAAINHETAEHRIHFAVSAPYFAIFAHHFHRK